MRIDARHVSWASGARQIVEDVSLSVASGEFLGIIGPNGSGKTTLISMLAGLRRPKSGTVALNGADVAGIARRDLAARVALVEQQAETSERLTARQAVELGRTPHLGFFDPWSMRDDRIVDEALEAVDMAAFGSRSWHTLSGGERQRLHIARALVQQPQLLILDEPTNHLDIGHQIGLLRLVRRLQLTVVAALHDLNHAALFCDRIAVMKHGRLMAVGAPQQVLTAALISDVFEVDARVETLDGQLSIRFAVEERATGMPVTRPDADQAAGCLVLRK
jgi:iron complex transport system ATP-binding protein